MKSSVEIIVNMKIVLVTNSAVPIVHFFDVYFMLKICFGGEDKQMMTIVT